MLYGTMLPGFSHNMKQRIIVYSFDAETEKFTSKFYSDDKYNTLKEFVANIPKLFPKSKYKAFTVQLLGWESTALGVLMYDNHGREYANEIEFCAAVRAQFDATGVPYHFTFFEAVFTSKLLAGNISIKPEETVLCIGIEDEGLATLTEVKFAGNGYLLLRDERLNDPYNDKNIQEQIIDRRNTVILVVANLPTNALFVRKLQRKLPNSSSKLIVVDKRVMNDFFGKGMIGMAKWIVDKKRYKYAILPSCARKYMVMADNVPLMIAEFATPLPLEKSCIVSNSTAKYTLVIEDHFTKKVNVINQLQLPENCRQYSITLTIDEENSPTCEVKPHLIDEILNLLSTLNVSMKSEIPVIGFWDNSSVICIYNGEEKDGYKFLDSWNGSSGEQLYISLDEENPKYNQAAASILATKPATVVFDILRILSIPSPESAKLDEAWKFKITKDENNPILVELENFDGTQKFATPAFIMALFLKEHLRVIKAEIGEKPKELGFIVWDKTERFDVDEMKRIKNGLEEACELLKIKCTFV